MKHKTRYIYIVSSENTCHIFMATLAGNTNMTGTHIISHKKRETGIHEWCTAHDSIIVIKNRCETHAVPLMEDPTCMSRWSWISTLWPGGALSEYQQKRGAMREGGATNDPPNVPALTLRRAPSMVTLHTEREWWGGKVEVSVGTWKQRITGYNLQWLFRREQTELDIRGNPFPHPHLIPPISGCNLIFNYYKVLLYQYKI